MNDTLNILKDAVAEYEFSRKVRRALTSVRLIDESDDESDDDTFARVMRLARKMITGSGCKSTCTASRAFASRCWSRTRRSASDEAGSRP